MYLFICVIVSLNLLGPARGAVPDEALYRGCFNIISLTRKEGHLIHPFEAEKCLELCSGEGEDIAALHETNSICYCGDEILSKIHKADGSLCKPCKDGNNLFCGGAFQLSVYQVEPHAVFGSPLDEHENVDRSEPEFQEEPVILLAGHDGIYRYNISSGNSTAVIQKKLHIEALDYHLTRNEGYAIWDSEIYRFPLFEDHPVFEEATAFYSLYSRCHTFAVDWVHDKMFLPDCHAHHILTMDIRHEHYLSDVIIELPDEGAWALDMAVDPYKGLLFWTTGAVLWSVRLDGRELTKVIPEFPVNRVSSLSLDLATERVYFFGQDKHDKNSSKVFYTSYYGSLSHTLQYAEYEGGNHLLSFGIFNHHMYYVKGVDENSSTVVQTKLEYNHRPTTIDHGNFKVRLLRLVHPKLQSPGRVDACTHHGCSNLCVLEDSEPRCFCPLYHSLDPDNRTCSFDPKDREEVPFLWRVVYGMAMILLVILGGGVLLCLCDKLWSQLHPTVVRLRVAGANKHTLTGRRRPDGENLI